MTDNRPGSVLSRDRWWPGYLHLWSDSVWSPAGSAVRSNLARGACSIRRPAPRILHLPPDLRPEARSSVSSTPRACSCAGAAVSRNITSIADG